MCVGKKRQQPNKNLDEPDEPNEDPERHQANIFADYDSQYAVQRALLLQRLVNDPFYSFMNISSVSRIWMMRHMLFLHGHLHNRHDYTLLQFFESLGTWRVVKYLQYKNAPNEMIKKWEAVYPKAVKPVKNPSFLPGNPPQG